MNRDIMQLGVWHENCRLESSLKGYSRGDKALTACYSLRNVLFGGLNSTPAAAGRDWTPLAPLF